MTWDRSFRSALARQAVSGPATEAQRKEIAKLRHKRGERWTKKELQAMTKDDASREIGRLRS